MLTPHQLARLFVIIDAPETADIASPDLDALVQQELVRCVARIGEPVEIRLTERGTQVLARLGGADPRRYASVGRT